MNQTDVPGKPVARSPRGGARNRLSAGLHPVALHMTGLRLDGYKKGYTAIPPSLNVDNSEIDRKTVKRGEKVASPTGEIG